MNASYTKASRSKTPLRRRPLAGARSTRRWPSSTRAQDRPSIDWRRQFSLLLGLERLLSEEEPHLADDTVLSAHQVDALSGTLTALLAEAQRNGNGARAATAASGARRARLHGGPGRGDAGLDAEGDLADEADLEDEAEAEDEEPQDWQDAGELDADVDAELSEDPNADRASGSSTRPAPARPSQRSGSSRPPARAAC